MFKSISVVCAITELPLILVPDWCWVSSLVGDELNYITELLCWSKCKGHRHHPLLQSRCVTMGQGSFCCPRILMSIQSWGGNIKIMSIPWRAERLYFKTQPSHLHVYGKKYCPRWRSQHLRWRGFLRYSRRKENSMFHLLRLPQKNLRRLQEMEMSLHKSDVETLWKVSWKQVSPGNPTQASLRSSASGAFYEVGNIWRSSFPQHTRGWPGHDIPHSQHLNRSVYFRGFHKKALDDFQASISWNSRYTHIQPYSTSSFMWHYIFFHFFHWESLQP